MFNLFRWHRKCSMWFVTFFRLLPESPRWLILAGRYDEANAILCKISKYNGKSAHNSSKMKQKIEVGNRSAFRNALLFIDANIIINIYQYKYELYFYFFFSFQMLGEKLKMQEYNEKKHSPFVFFKYPTLRKRFLLVTACWLDTLLFF